MNFLSNIYIHLEQNIAKNRYSSYTHPPYQLEKKLILAIKQCDLTASLAILDDINALERASLSKIPLNSLKYSLVASCTLFTRAIIESGVDSETAFMLSDYYLNLIDQSQSQSATQALEYKMLKDFIFLLNTHKAFIYNPLINRAIKYIKNNLENKLTLSSIAESIDIHPNYLAHIFKKEVGKTLLEYIDEQKIQVIKNYLIYTSSSIGEISTIFGFSNPSYFSKYFKKHALLSPSEYRKVYSLMP